MKSRKVLKEVKIMLRVAIDDPYVQMNETLLSFNEELLEFIEELEKQPDVKERDNPYIYKPKSELNFATPRDWNKEERDDE